jgi:cysteine desulfurase
MLPFFTEKYGNPSSIHRFGGLIRRNVEKAREQAAALLNARPQEIYFTSCGTESDNMALQGFVRAHGRNCRVITSAVEHPAVLNTCRQLKKEGAEEFEIGVDADGMLLMDQLAAASIDENTIVSLMWANNETGVLFPIKEAAELVKARGGVFHTDAVQAAGKVAIDVTRVPVDMLAISGHKIHAPKGVGIMFIREGTPVAPLLFGGHQERGLRAGTENVPYIVGLGIACELAMRGMDEESARTRRMRDRLENALLKSCTGARLNGHKEARLPNTTNISFEFIEGEGVLLLLDEKGIAASSGSACTTGSLEPSHVMKAMGVPYTLAHSSIRFSLSRSTADRDIDAVIEALPPIVDRLRSLSPFVNS